jgi:hypothetical protein
MDVPERGSPETITIIFCDDPKRDFSLTNISLFSIMVEVLIGMAVSGWVFSEVFSTGVE